MWTWRRRFRRRRRRLSLLIEELEDSRPHHRHHASAVAVHLEVLERKTALAHVTRHHAAALERRGRAGALGHEDRQSPDPIERIRRLVDERPRHRRHRAPPLGIPGRQVPRATAAHRVAGKVGARAIGAVLLGDDLQRGHHLELAQVQLALARRRDSGPLRGGRRGLAEDRRQPKGIAIGAERCEPQRRDDDVAVLFGELHQQAIGLIQIRALICAGAVQHQDDRQRRLPVPRLRDVDAIRHLLTRRRKDILPALVAGGTR